MRQTNSFLLMFIVFSALFLVGCVTTPKVKPDTNQETEKVLAVDEDNEPVEQIDPPSLEIDAGPADTEVDSVADDLQAIVVLADEEEHGEDAPIKETIEKKSNNENEGDNPSLTKLANNYYRFDKAHYEKSLSEGKIIFFDFHADWCPTCVREKPNILAAFNELDDPNVVGYQVHYNDGNTNDEDVEVTKKYGITYQHTKVVVNSDGTQSSKSLESFSKDKVLQVIAAAS